jgi:hypothetical protein
MKNVAVFATFRDRLHAETAVKELVNSGFREEDISVLLADNVGTRDFATERHSKAPEGAASGGGIGALIGGQYLTAGPAIDALAGAGAIGILGGMLGGIFGLGVPEFEAKRYRGLIKDGRSLLSVHCDSSDWVTRARHVLKSVGGQGVVTKSEATAGFSPSNKVHLRYGSAHWPAK